MLQSCLRPLDGSTSVRAVVIIWGLVGSCLVWGCWALGDGLAWPIFREKQAQTLNPTP